MTTSDFLLHCQQVARDLVALAHLQSNYSQKHPIRLLHQLRNMHQK